MFDVRSLQNVIFEHVPDQIRTDSGTLQHVHPFHFAAIGFQGEEDVFHGDFSDNVSVLIIGLLNQTYMNYR